MDLNSLGGEVLLCYVLNRAQSVCVRVKWWLSGSRVNQEWQGKAESTAEVFREAESFTFVQINGISKNVTQDSLLLYQPLLTQSCKISHCYPPTFIKLYSSA